jgi:aromatic ring-opening dioxygenase LigB subunit
MVLKHERKPLGHAVMFLLVMLASSAISKESGILTRMLYASFLAEQGVAVCIVADPAFARETRGPMGYMRDYAQHVKAEVTAGLNETETHSLLKSAAGLAKAEALQALRSLRPEGLEIETARVTRE